MTATHESGDQKPQVKSLRELGITKEELLEAIKRETEKLFDPIVDEAMIAYVDALESGQENAREVILNSAPAELREAVEAALTMIDDLKWLGQNK